MLFRSFWSLFAWKIFFQPFTFSLYVSPVSRWVSIDNISLTSNLQNDSLMECSPIWTWAVLFSCLKVKVLVALLCPTLCHLMDCCLPDSCPWEYLGKNTGVGCHFLLHGIFPTQESNQNLLHCRQILYHLSHLDSG